MNGQSIKLKTIGITLAIVVSLVGLTATGIAVVRTVDSKADQSEVDEIKESLHVIDKDVTIIKTELRMFIRASRPNLPIGKE